jgi:hypothetical protein
MHSFQNVPLTLSIEHVFDRLDRTAITLRDGIQIGAFKGSELVLLGYWLVNC